MDTIYYHLNARRVKVSGGPDLVTFVRAAAEAVPQGGGEVLDFARGKLRLERKALLQEVFEETTPVEEPDAADEAEQSGAKSSRFPVLELVCSLAVLAVSASAVLAFLSLL